MVTYKYFLLEAKTEDLKAEFHYLFKDLDEFLRREKIIGFTENILSIIIQKPTVDVISDIKESFRDKDGIDLDTADIMSMEVKDMLEKYLEWQGIPGYTEPIISLAAKTSFVKKDRDLLVWMNKYYYRPEKGATSIWVWDNPELEGIPELIEVEKIYGTLDYKGKDYYKTEKVYQKNKKQK